MAISDPTRSDSLQFSDQLREQMQRNRITAGGNGNGGDDFMEAVHAHARAKQTGDAVAVAAARAAVEVFLKEPAESAPDFGAGARPPAPVPADMNKILRRDRYGWR